MAPLTGVAFTSTMPRGRTIGETQVLFNTLAYAKFFALVFAASWLLVRRSGGLWLPWLALAAAGMFGNQTFGAATPPAELPSRGTELLVLGLVGCGFGLTWLLTRRAEPRSTPTLSQALLCAALNNSLLAIVVYLKHHQHLVEFFWQTCLDRPALHSSPRPLITCALVALATMPPVALALRVARLRLWLLLVASYVFYSRWDLRFLALIFASSSIDYWLGLRIGATEEPRTRRRWLILTVVLNLGVLCGFKYLNFGVDALMSALHAFGYTGSVTVLQIALPIGISFFTFESMSYVIDVYRRDLPAHRSYLEYLTFVAFFPHLVAGPIVRPRDLLPQLAATPRFSAEAASHGLHLIAWGLIKKVAIGDYLALNLVDRVFDAPAQYSSLECYAAVVGYAIQIYCDFSGYTDIAIGSAALLGVRFPQNFNAPYKATSVQDFWRRWHISLSTWLRDYLYVSLGGNRRGRVRTYINLFLTMLLGGLWHGASWTFVIWGGMHGLALVVTRALGKQTSVRVPQWLGQFLTFHFVCATWVFFRAPTFGSAGAIFQKLAQLTTYTVHIPASVVLALGVGITTHLLPERWYIASRDRFAHAPAWAQGLVLVGAALILREVASADAVPFVYFQF